MRAARLSLERGGHHAGIVVGQVVEPAPPVNFFNLGDVCVFPILRQVAPNNFPTLVAQAHFAALGAVKNGNLATVADRQRHAPSLHHGLRGHAQPLGDDCTLLGRGDVVKFDLVGRRAVRGRRVSHDLPDPAHGLKILGPTIRQVLERLGVDGVERRIAKGGGRQTLDLGIV